MLQWPSLASIWSKIIFIKESHISHCCVIDVKGANASNKNQNNNSASNYDLHLRIVWNNPCRGFKKDGCVFCDTGVTQPALYTPSLANKSIVCTCVKPTKTVHTWQVNRLRWQITFLTLVVFLAATGAHTIHLITGQVTATAVPTLLRAIFAVKPIQACLIAQLATPARHAA